MRDSRILSTKHFYGSQNSSIVLFPGNLNHADVSRRIVLVKSDGNVFRTIAPNLSNAKSIYDDLRNVIDIEIIRTLDKNTESPPICMRQDWREYRQSRFANDLPFGAVFRP